MLTLIFHATLTPDYEAAARLLSKLNVGMLLVLRQAVRTLDQLITDEMTRRSIDITSQVADLPDL